MQVGDRQTDGRRHLFPLSWAGLNKPTNRCNDDRDHGLLKHKRFVEIITSVVELWAPSFGFQ